MMRDGVSVAAVLAMAVLILASGCQAGGKVDQPATQPGGQVGPTTTQPAGPVVRIEAEKFTTVTKATVKAYPEASGGKAVLFDRDTSVIETTVALPAGKYKVIAVGIAPDQYQDALDLLVWQGQTKTKLLDGRAVFGSTYKAFVASSTPAVFTTDGTAPVRVMLRTDNKTGAAVDYVELAAVK